MIYLDNNATTAIDPEVADLVAKTLLDGPANPSSQHSMGRRAAALIEESLERIAASLGTDFSLPGGPRLIWTSGGTEANNLALCGLGLDESAAEPDQGSLVVSRIEHPSVLAVAQQLEKRHQSGQLTRRRVRWVPATRDGLIDLSALQSILNDPDSTPTLVSIMSANNETGVIQPIDQVSELCRDAGVLLHVDATQSIGKLPVNLSSLGASAVSFTAHKFHGPAGIGALWLKAGVTLRPMLFGGEQQLTSRPGTEPVALIVAMAKALQIATDQMDATIEWTSGLRDRLEQGIRDRLPDVIVHGLNSPRLPGTTCISFPGTDRQSMLMALDLAGVSCSSGSACSSGSSPPSHVLIAMGVDDSSVQSALRFGVSKFSTGSDIDAAIDVICHVYNRLSNKKIVEN